MYADKKSNARRLRVIESMSTVGQLVSGVVMAIAFVLLVSRKLPVTVDQKHIMHVIFNVALMCVVISSIVSIACTAIEIKQKKRKLESYMNGEDDHGE